MEFLPQKCGPESLSCRKDLPLVHTQAQSPNIIRLPAQPTWVPHHLCPPGASPTLPLTLKRASGSSCGRDCFLKWLSSRAGGGAQIVAKQQMCPRRAFLLAHENRKTRASYNHKGPAPRQERGKFAVMTKGPCRGGGAPVHACPTGAQGLGRLPRAGPGPHTWPGRRRPL